MSSMPTRQYMHANVPSCQRYAADRKITRALLTLYVCMSGKHAQYAVVAICDGCQVFRAEHTLLPDADRRSHPT